MNTKKFVQRMILALGQVMPGVMFLVVARQAQANPTGMTVQSGSASFTVNGTRFTVTAGNNAMLNWQSFNIASGETTIFNQPSASSIVWNRINDQNPSQIYGSLQANGVVVLLNSSGFYFGPNSFVSAAGLVVSTANCVPPQNGGGAWEFNGPPPLASIVNYGHIQIGDNGSCFLIGNQVENHGTIEAPGGTVGLAAGQTVMLSERADGRGLSMKVTLPQGSVDNYGTLIADAGTISLDAKVVNQGGLIQANSVRNDHGTIELVASDQLNLGANSKISANGDDTVGGSAGGAITLKSDNSFSDASGSEISVKGGANGGNGGTVEISAPVMPAIHSTVDGTAQAGATGGKLLLDPDYIILDQSGSDATSGGTVGVNDSPGGTLDLNVNSAFFGFSQITLQAAYDITLADFTTWSLSDTTGQTSGQLVLEAGRNIIFGNASSIYDYNSWSIAMYAGVTDFANQIVSPGAGSIYLNATDPNNPSEYPYNPSGYIQTGAGSITMEAGQDITVGTGRVTTTAGGSIFAHALAGNIDTGGYAQGYIFQPGNSMSTAYTVDSFAEVGGISTTGGGDVTLMAGGDVTSILPAEGGYYYDGNFVSAYGDPNPMTAGSGCYGFGSSQAGNFSIIAGGNVTGHYLVANGAGNIYAGVKMDANGNPVTDTSGNYVMGSTGSAGTDLASPNLSLSLIKGGWNVTAAQDIILQEVNNPNGVFNTKRGVVKHNFDYDLSDYVNLDAGNLVQLGGSAALLPRLDSSDGVQVPVIYPGILNVTAGAGGVVLTGDSTYNSLTLFPSPQGSMTFNTTAGGSLVAGSFQNGDLVLDSSIFDLIMSDADYTQRQFTSGRFGIDDHAATPVHYGSETPLKLNISGDMDNILLAAPEAAQITVGGNMNDSRFRGMNLSSSDTTSISVTGDINNRGDFTTIDLSQIAGAAAPDLSELQYAVPPAGDPSVSALLNSLYYNPTTHLLTYQNITSATINQVVQLLENLPVQLFINGVPQWQDPADTIPVTTTVAVLNAATANALLAAYKAPLKEATGYEIGGGGTFSISAHNLDLGTTAGIQSWGVGLYNIQGDYPLANYFSKGPNIDVNLTGDLTMFSSSIASLNGGNISVDAAGSVNVGSPDFTVNSLGARGIYTTGQGDVSVIADGNVNVNGSRIAAYDGGNVTVESLNGDVNAGTGGSGFVVVNSYSVQDGQVVSSSPTIPGSGILATTFPDDAGQVVGNILVEAPNGNINASSGGIVQLPLNGVNTAESLVDVLAGYELRDGNGNPVDAAQISSGTPVQVATGDSVGNIDASGSGVIGSTVGLKATGNITGAIFARNNIDISAQQNISVTALAQGNINVNSGGSLSGTLIGVGGISASGGSVEANLESNSGISGSTSGSKGLAQGTAANSASQSASATDSNATDTGDKSNDDNGDDLKKKKKPISLARKVSRVTVILPGEHK